MHARRTTHTHACRNTHTRAPMLVALVDPTQEERAKVERRFNYFLLMVLFSPERLKREHRETERYALTMYRLSKHSLAIEKGRPRQTWLSSEDRLCAHCPQNEVETELHFLTSCPIYDHIRETYFPQIHTDPQRI